MYRIAHIENDLTGKFGIPRQSGLVDELKGRIVFEPEFRNADALRGLEEFSHIWLIWEFSESVRRGGSDEKECEWKPTVRPPRLGGNARLGVFATRSPFRPNPIGLSCVKLESIDYKAQDGPVLIVSGADLMNGTPIFDIKPYIPYADCKADAKGGFTESVERTYVEVVIPEEIAKQLKPESLKALEGILREDPRPAYQNDPEREYTFSYGKFEVSFKCDGKLLTVTGLNKSRKSE